MNHRLIIALKRIVAAKSWERINKPIDLNELNFDNWYAVYKDLDWTGSDPMESLEAYWFPQALKEAKSFSFPLKLWRGVCDKPEDLDYQNLGVHWTWIEKEADCYWEKQGERIDFSNPKGHELILATEVDRNDIDWGKTVRAWLDPEYGYLYSDPDAAESEIVLKDNIKIKINDVYDKKTGKSIKFDGLT